MNPTYREKIEEFVLREKRERILLKKVQICVNDVFSYYYAHLINSFIGKRKIDDNCMYSKS